MIETLSESQSIRFQMPHCQFERKQIIISATLPFVISRGGQRRNDTEDGALLPFIAFQVTISCLLLRHLERGCMEV